VGGYGTVKWVNAKDYAACSPDTLCDRRYADPLQQINLLNDVFREAIPTLFEVLPGGGGGLVTVTYSHSTRHHVKRSPPHSSEIV
jgi:hypothetical protein